MTIGKIAHEAGVGVETIRYYERRGLIEQPPKPPLGGHRIYPEQTIERVRFVREAQALGFSLREIQGLLKIRNDPSTDCAEILSRAQQKLTEIKEKQKDLRRLRATLEELIATCPGKGASSSCSIIRAMERPGKASSSRGPNTR
jgi:MerR family mercuric resistance operon transcriptional regulator